MQNGEGNIGTESKKWKNLWVENINGANADGIPVGIILAYGGNGNVPAGYLLCDGSTVSREMFPDLFKAVGTDYGAGDGSTTFNLPDYNQAKRFVQGSMTAGTVKEAGLPDIKGRIMDTPEVNGGYAGTGAFAVDSGAAGGGTNGITPGANWVGSTLDVVWRSFDASRSSNIYGKSDTVQPDALTARYIIKAFSGQSEDSALVNITNYVNDLAGKANRSLSNLTEAGRAFSFPSDTFVSMGIAANGQTYITPADGCVYLTCVALGSSWIACTDSVSGLRFTDVTGTASQILAFVQPVRKGQTLIIGYSNVGGFDARFYYAQGEVPGGDALVENPT